MDENKAPRTREYFAELYVAGLLADAGWTIYFTSRDKGFDFIISKVVQKRTIIRPVQVTGLYPTDTKKDRQVYGVNRTLTQFHENMVLIIPIFIPKIYAAPKHVAYITAESGKIVKNSKNKYRVFPAKIKNGIISPRRDFQQYYDRCGLVGLESNSSD
ncbi:MAG: hypothetical protein AABZ39_11735 [Spirochaetota bacterium]